MGLLNVAINAYTIPNAKNMPQMKQRLNVMAKYEILDMNFPNDMGL
jgi:hypothetical protein